MKYLEKHLFKTMADLSVSAENVYAKGGVEVLPLSDALGAEVRGANLNQNLSHDSFIAIHRALLEHCVIRLRGQSISDERLVSFSRLFGELDLPPNTGGKTTHATGFPEVFVVSNVFEDGEPIGSLSYTEADWHTDMCHTELPPKASTLFALEIPSDGSGSTGFLNMYKAYDMLPDNLRKQIKGKKMKHDIAHPLQGKLRAGFNEKEYENIVEAPGCIHPIIRTHPETGRQALYIGRQWNGDHRGAYILGMSFTNSNEIQDEIWDFLRGSLDCLGWFQHWQVGDFIMWDNRCVMHYRPEFTATERRIMHRTQIKDSVRPF